MCSAIRRVRAAANLTQVAFAQQVGTSSLNVSRWERGKFAPRDREMLQRLRTAAANVGLTAEENLFLDALLAVPSSPRFDTGPATIPNIGFRDWELMMAARIASGFLPEEENAARAALSRSLGLLHEVIAADVARGGAMDASFYKELERTLIERVAPKILSRLKEKQ